MEQKKGEKKPAVRITQNCTSSSIKRGVGESFPPGAAVCNNQREP